MKIRSVEAEWFHADRWTGGLPEMTKLIVAFRNFANGSKRLQTEMEHTFYAQYVRSHVCFTNHLNRHCLNTRV